MRNVPSHLRPPNSKRMTRPNHCLGHQSWNLRVRRQSSAAPVAVRCCGEAERKSHSASAEQLQEYAAA